MCNLKRDDVVNLLVNRKIHRLRECTSGSRGQDGGLEQMQSLVGCVHTGVFKVGNQQSPLCSTWNGQCHGAGWREGECGGEWIPLYVWLGPFVVHLKPS